MREILSTVRGGPNAADQTAAQNTADHRGTSRRRAKRPACLWLACGIIPQLALGRLGGRGTIFYSASPTALEDCGRPPSCSQCVAILHELSVLASSLE